MGLDSKMSDRAVVMRKAVAKMMEDHSAEINKHYDATTFPFFIADKIRAIGINGLQIKGYGSSELSTLESGAMCYELAVMDGSVATFFMAHNAIGM